ncbi:MAG: hypothetical protein RLZZ338_2696 [Cyanobacteriota bacterium]
MRATHQLSKPPITIDINRAFSTMDNELLQNQDLQQEETLFL